MAIMAVCWETKALLRYALLSYGNNEVILIVMIDLSVKSF